MYAKSMGKKRRPRLIDLGRRIKALRGSMSTYDFGHKLGVSGGAVRMWESGARDPGIEGLWRMAESFNISITDILASDQVAGPSDAEAKSQASDTTLNLEDLADVLKAYGKAPQPLQNEIRARLGLATVDHEVLDSEVDEYVESQSKPEPSAKVEDRD